MQDEPGGAFQRNESYKHICAVSKALARPWKLLEMSRMLLAPALIPACSLPGGGVSLHVTQQAGGACCISLAGLAEILWDRCCAANRLSLVLWQLKPCSHVPWIWNRMLRHGVTMDSRRSDN